MDAEFKLKSLLDVFEHMKNEVYADANYMPSITSPITVMANKPCLAQSEAIVINLSLKDNLIGTLYRATGNEINIYTVNSRLDETFLGSVPSAVRDISRFANLAYNRAVTLVKDELAAEKREMDALFAKYAPNDSEEEEQYEIEWD